jgi:hypothetical protein
MNGERGRTATGETEEPVEELAEEAAADNPDPQTRRETLELELMDEDRSEEGEHVEVQAAAERIDRGDGGSTPRSDPATR